MKLRFFVVVCLATSVTLAADAGDDFSNNLFSDLAPFVFPTPSKTAER